MYYGFELQKNGSVDVRRFQSKTQAKKWLTDNPARVMYDTGRTTHADWQHFAEHRMSHPESPYEALLFLWIKDRFPRVTPTTLVPSLSPLRGRKKAALDPPC